MSLKEDIEKVQKKVEEISLAREMIHEDQKKNKRLFIVLLVVLVMWFCTIVYLVYVLNDIGTVEDSDTIDIQDVENIDNSHIKMCDEWKTDFSKFYEWAINNGYKEELTIDRIDVNGNYEPSNCRWITMAVQNRNKRKNVK